MPFLSVILPVYNAERYLGAAVESVLGQSFRDFELLIIDDRSTDGTLAIAQSFNDSRVRIHQNEVNSGRAASDNRGHALATGEIFVKMDSDDTCHPQRFEKQVAFLEANPDVNVVGAWMQNFGASNYLNKYPGTAALAKSFTIFGLPVGNPSVTLRASLFREGGLRYDAGLRQTEDYDFFARYLHELKVVSLPESLVNYRNYPDSHKGEILVERFAVSNDVRRSLLTRWGIPFTESELQVHHAIAISATRQLGIPLNACAAWLEKLVAYNETCPWFDPQALARTAADRWFYSCYFSGEKKFGSWKAYYGNALSRSRTMGPAELLKFLFKNFARI